MVSACIAPSLGLRISQGEAAIAEVVRKLHAAYARVGSEP